MVLRVSVWENGRCVVVSVGGEVDLSNADSLTSQLLEVLDGGRHVVADLGEVSFLDSTGLSALVSAWKHARHRGGTFRVAAPQPPVAKVLQITDLDRLLEVFGSVEAACSAGPGAPPRP